MSQLIQENQNLEKKDSKDFELADSNSNYNKNNNNNLQLEAKSYLPHDQKNAFVKMFFIPNSDLEVKLNLKQQAIWKGFPISDRFLYSFFCGYRCQTADKSRKFLVDEIIENKCMLDERIDFRDKYLSLKILKTGSFDIEPCIIHPYVKVSIMNLKTAKYLQKKNFEVPAILQTEKNLIIQHNLAQNILEFRESALDFIPPIATNPCDLRIKGESFAEWNEEIIINDSADNIFQSENIIFFEILDFNLFQNAYSSMREYSTEEFIFPIAWGYLKPVGFSQTYLGKHKIQLYKYKYKRTEIMKKLKLTNNSYLRTPDVLFEFNWFKKEKYQTYLEIELNIDFKPSIQDLTKEFYFRKYQNSVFLNEADNNLQNYYGDEFDKNKLLDKKKSKNDGLSDKEKQRRFLLAKRRRFIGEDCLLPDKLLFKFETGCMGVLTQEFSPNGKFLAVGCSDFSSLTTIKIFNVEDGKLSFHFRGHMNLIHSFSWSLDNTILVSAGSDNNVIIWQIPQDDSNNSDNYDYLDNDKIFKMTNITHPSYVYTTAILPEDSKDMIILATGCFDGFVRIYSVNFILEEPEENFGSNSPVKSPIRESHRSPKGVINSGSNIYRSISGRANSKIIIPKKTFAQYVMVTQIAINEEFLHQDYLLGSRTNWKMTGKDAAPLSQSQFYQAEKERRSKLSSPNFKFLNKNYNLNVSKYHANKNYFDSYRDNFDFERNYDLLDVNEYEKYREFEKNYKLYNVNGFDKHTDFDRNFRNNSKNKFDKYRDFNSFYKNNTKNKFYNSYDFKTEEYLKRMNIKKEDFMNLNEDEKYNLIEKTVLEHRHPNSLFFDELGKLYIGDSLGAIHIWEIRVINAKPICNKIKVFTHKEIEGDDINKIYIEPGPKRRLIVHSRDNCIRLIDISKDKLKVIVRYYGLKCSKMNIKSTVSPDGNYIISGSEEGKFYLWSLFSGTPMDIHKYECDIVDPIVDISWNNQYNMFAVSGFGHNYPLLVYVHERQELVLDQIEYKVKGEEEILMKKSNDYYENANIYAFNRKDKDKIISAYRENFSDFSKEYKSIIEPHIKNN